MYQDPHSSCQYSGAASHAPGDLAPLRVGLLGLGTVGAGTLAVLQRNAALIAARAGRRIEVRRVAVRNLARARATLGDAQGRGLELCDNAGDVVQASDIDVVVEAIGGTGVARELVLQALAHGKHVVTANKALLAEHGGEIFAAAQAQGVVVAYEGAVAVSIPIIKALREGLAANRIEWVAGIINGTSNFILSAMRTEGLDFAQALARAQALGYAEADPALDVGGVDAAHKLSLLAANAFGTQPPFAQVQVQGIDTLDAVDIGFAWKLGFSVKLLGVARRCADGLELRVHPALLPADHLLAQVHGRMNAVMVQSDAAGTTLYYGAGAGAEPTASAVVADLVDLARAQGVPSIQRVPSLAFQPSALRALPAADPALTASAFYLRLDVERSELTVPRVLQELARHAVAVQRMQVLPHPDQPGPDCLVLLTATTNQRDVGAALEALHAWSTVLGRASVLRLAALE